MARFRPPSAPRLRWRHDRWRRSGIDQAGCGPGPAPRSAMRSSGSSIPTEATVPGPIADQSRAQVTSAAGIRRDYQRFRRAEAAAIANSVSASANRLPASSPPAMSKLTMLPKSSISERRDHGRIVRKPGTTRAPPRGCVQEELGDALRAWHCASRRTKKVLAAARGRPRGDRASGRARSGPIAWPGSARHDR